MISLLKLSRTTCLSVCLALFLAITVDDSWAGQNCEEKPPTPTQVLQGYELAHQVHQLLNGSQAKLAFIARAGQDLSRYGLHYSHLGIVQRVEPQIWRVTHLLNQCGSASSDIFIEGLANFFMDDPHRYQALILIPSDALQEKLHAVMTHESVRRFHQPNYNMLAFPFSTQYQNSNQWVLEMIAVSHGGATDISHRSQAQTWLKQNAFQPSTIELSALTRLGARMFRANIAFDDHPFGRRMAGQIDTITVESVERFIVKLDPSTQRHEVSLPQQLPSPLKPQ